MDDRPLVFLDVETTGLNPWQARVTEIGAVKVEQGQVTGHFKQLVNPGTPIPPFITQLTGIDGALLAGAPSFADIFDALMAFLDGCTFVAHNVGFDYGFIKAECVRLHQPFDTDRFCTARLSRSLYPSQRRHSLEAIIRIHGITVASRHRAYDDASAAYAFYKLACAQHGQRAFNTIKAITISRAPVKL